MIPLEKISSKIKDLANISKIERVNNSNRIDDYLSEEYSDIADLIDEKETVGIASKKNSFSVIDTLTGSRQDPNVIWVPNSDINKCSASSCNKEFGFFVRKHHCRLCGKIFCRECSNYWVHKSQFSTGLK
jgi:tRNA A37 threonylcarbamoyladenosine dehydratase